MPALKMAVEQSLLLSLCFELQLSLSVPEQGETLLIFLFASFFDPQILGTFIHLPGLSRNPVKRQFKLEESDRCHLDRMNVKGGQRICFRILLTFVPTPRWK